MTPRPLALAAFVAALLPLSAAAQQDQPSPKQDKKGFYRIAGRSWQEQDVIKRKTLSTDITLDHDSKFIFCMIPPASDWVLDSQDEQLEQNYLHLIALALELDGGALHDKDEGTDKDDHKLSDNPSDRFVEAGGGVVGYCGNYRSPNPRADLSRIDAGWWERCKNPVEAAEIGRYTCTAYQGGRVYPPKFPMVKTLRALIRSPRPKTAIAAMSLAEEIKDRRAFFLKSVHDVLVDTGKPVAVRERAATALASLDTSDTSALVLAKLWRDRSTPESLRKAALHGFSVILGFGDWRRSGQSLKCFKSGASCDRLRELLSPNGGGGEPGLIQVLRQETTVDDKGKEKLTPLGELVLCVAGGYSGRWVWYAKHYKSGWYDQMRADEAKGVDQSKADQKLQDYDKS